MVEKLACVVLFSEICPLKFVAALLCNHTVSEEDNDDDNNSEERQKKEKKLSKNKAMLWLKMNTINTDVSWFDDIFSLDRSTKNLPLAWEAVE